VRLCGGEFSKGKHYRSRKFGIFTEEIFSVKRIKVKVDQERRQGSTQQAEMVPPKGPFDANYPPLPSPMPSNIVVPKEPAKMSMTEFLLKNKGVRNFVLEQRLLRKREE